MKIITLGKTNLKVNKNGFGALPIQRISEKEAVYLLHKAYVMVLISMTQRGFIPIVKRR